jgi:hypothetical protein
MKVVILVLLVLWAIIGLLSWIPLLTRTIVIAVGGVLASVFTGADISPIRASLEMAVSFYAAGFARIRNLMDEDASMRPVRMRDGELDIIRLLLETLWAVVFWGGAIWVLMFATHKLPVLESTGSQAAGSSAPGSHTKSQVLRIAFHKELSVTIPGTWSPLFAAQRSTLFRVTPNEMAWNKTLNYISLELIVCNVGDQGIYFPPLYAWYTSQTLKATFHWTLKMSDDGDFVRSAECRRVRDVWSPGYENSYNYIGEWEAMLKATGILYLSFSEGSSLASIDFKDAISKGLLDVSLSDE